MIVLKKQPNTVNFTGIKFHCFSQRKLRNCKVISACLHCCFRLRDWKADSNIRGWWRSRQWNSLIWYWNWVTHFFSMSLLIKIVIGLKTLQLSMLPLMCQILCMSVCTCILMLVSHLWLPIKTYYKYRSNSFACKKSYMTHTMFNALFWCPALLLGSKPEHPAKYSTFLVRLTVGDSFENCADPQ